MSGRAERHTRVQQRTGGERRARCTRAPTRSRHRVASWATPKPSEVRQGRIRSVSRRTPQIDRLTLRLQAARTSCSRVRYDAPEASLPAHALASPNVEPGRPDVDPIRSHARQRCCPLLEASSVALRNRPRCGPRPCSSSPLWSPASAPSSRAMRKAPSTQHIRASSARSTANPRPSASRGCNRPRTARAVWSPRACPIQKCVEGARRGLTQAGVTYTTTTCAPDALDLSDVAGSGSAPVAHRVLAPADRARARDCRRARGSALDLASD